MNWPVVVATTGFVAAVVLVARLALTVTGGVWLYASDDAYIGMAIGRSLGSHLMWGVTPDAFTGATTSLLWPLVLAGPSHLGSADWWPLWLNVVAAVGTLVVAQRALARYTESRVGQATVLIAIVGVAGLPALALTGMEHSLQVCLTLAVAAYGVSAVSQLSTSRRTMMAAFTLAALVVSARFDTAAMVAAVMAIAMVRRRWALVAALAAGAMVPVIVYAMAAMANGWPWLPTSVLSKSRALEWMSDDWLGRTRALLWTPLGLVLRSPQLLALMVPTCVLLGAVWRHPEPRASEARVWLIVVVSTLWLHLTLGAGTSISGFRYDMYVMTLGACGIGVAMGVLWPTWGSAARMLATVGLVVASGVLVRYAGAITEQVLADLRFQFASTHQFTRVLSQFDTGPMPALQDLGEPVYRLRRQILDSDGLATLDIFVAQREGSWTAERFEALARTRGTRVAVIAPRGCGTDEERPLPSSWISVGQWWVDGCPAAAFVAADPEMAERLAAALRAAAPDLPAGVVFTPPPA